MWTSKLKHWDISSKKVSFDFPKFKHFITKKRVFSRNPFNVANDRILRISQLDIEGTIKKKKPKFKTTLTSRLDTFTAKNRVAILHSWIFKCCC